MSPKIPSAPVSGPVRRFASGGRLPSAVLRLLAAGMLLTAAGCDYIGIEPAAKIQARMEAEARAVGSACRQAGRALEDCYAYHAKLNKAAIFAGWKDMNDYMTQNNLAEIKPEVPPVLPRRNKPAGSDDDSKPSGQAG